MKAAEEDFGKKGSEEKPGAGLVQDSSHVLREEETYKLTEGN